MNSTIESSDQVEADEVAPTRELALLEALADNPQARQVDLATRLGVAVGTVNWIVKRLAAKGFVRVRRMSRWQWSYLVTPQGLARKAHLTHEYVRVSMELYRTTREQARQAIQEIREGGYTSVRLEEDSNADLVDVCRLTCLEQGIRVAAQGPRNETACIPKLRVSGCAVVIEWPEGAADDG